MQLDDYLESVSLVDCTGQESHRLTLMIDGSVKVQMGQIEATVDPPTRLVKPSTRQLGWGEYGHDQVVDMACLLARGG